LLSGMPVCEIKIEPQSKGRVLWLSHRRSLLEQAFDTFAHASHLASTKARLAMMAISSQDKNWSNVEAGHDVVFSMVQSAATKRNLNFIDLMIQQSRKGLFVVVDEAHHAAAPSYQRVLKLLKERECPILGLSATPVRMAEDDERRMWNIFEHFVYEIKLKELIAQGILSTPNFKTIETHVEFEREFDSNDFTHLAKFGDLGPQVLNRIAKHAGRNKLIVEHYLENRELYGKTLVFAVDVLHARTLASEFKEQGVAADYVDYTRSDCKAVMDAYKASIHPEVLINVDMLTEGFDAPKTQTVFLARPSRSEALLSQMTGRALRGTQAGGTEMAYLVTFVDTWKEFNPLDAKYVVDIAELEGLEPIKPLPKDLIPIADELIAEAYRLVKSNVKGTFLGVHQCLPHSWYYWEEEYENDIQRRYILVFENQVEGFQKLIAEYADSSSIPAEIEEPLARDLLRRYFGDCPDPLPRWTEIRSLLNAYREKLDIHHYTFADKAEFDPAKLARDIYDRKLSDQEKPAYLQKIYDEKPVCQLVYRNDFQAFYEDVNLQLLKLIAWETGKARDPIIPQASMPKVVSEWPEGHSGYRLGEIWDAVISQPKHFPNGVPEVRDLCYSDKPLKNLWGFFRYDDKRVCVNRTLNTPDVPRFVLEFLVYHEALHADMPNSGHDSGFRERERRFIPSEAAASEAAQAGFVPGQSAGAWYALADQFLDSSQLGQRNERMEM